MRSDFIVVINGVSGGKRGLKLALYLAKTGLAPYRFASCAQEVRDLAQQAVRLGYERFVLAGGDGTMSLPLEPLLYSKTALAPIAIGRGNEFARTVGIPEKFGPALETARKGRQILVDVGWIETSNGQLNRPFLSMCNFGFEAVVAKTCEQSGRKSAWSYPSQLLKHLFGRCEAYDIEARSEWSDFKGAAFSLAVANVPTEGRYFRIAPEARVDDGFLDVNVIEPMVLPLRLFYAAMTLTGRHIKFKKNHCWQGNQIHIRVPADCPCHLDGEPCIMTGREATITLKPKALRVIVPQTPG